MHIQNAYAFLENPMCADSEPVADKLNFAGKIADEIIGSLTEIFPIEIDKYVIMPNHVHILITILEGSSRKGCDATICRVIGFMKRKVTIALRERNVDDVIWKRSFYDHIVRNEADYRRIWNYIENNPQKWAEDCYFKKHE